MISNDNCTLMVIIIIYLEGVSWNYFLKKPAEKMKSQ